MFIIKCTMKIDPSFHAILRRTPIGFARCKLLRVPLSLSVGRRHGETRRRYSVRGLCRSSQNAPPCSHHTAMSLSPPKSLEHLHRAGCSSEYGIRIRRWAAEGTTLLRVPRDLPPGPLGGRRGRAFSTRDEECRFGEGECRGSYGYVAGNLREERHSPSVHYPSTGDQRRHFGSTSLLVTLVFSRRQKTLLRLRIRKLTFLTKNWAKAIAT